MSDGAKNTVPVWAWCVVALGIAVLAFQGLWFYVELFRAVWRGFHG